MQDRYAGDLGDFLKFGLLRNLVTGDGAAPPLALGVVWCRTVDESHNADGKHVLYLEPGHRLGQYLRTLDADLYDRLAVLVSSGVGSVSALERAGVLASDTAYFSELLDLSEPPSATRAARRAAWVSRAATRMGGCDLVFVDPDNGLRGSTHNVPRYRLKSVKHTYLDELLPYARRQQSIVAYHHADRSATVEEQAQRRLAALAEELPLTPLAAVRASRGTTRLFLVTAAAAHEGLLRQRLQAIEASRWRDELRLIWAA